jgi:hypothetical protein
MAHADVGLKVLGNPSLTSTLPRDVRPGRKYGRTERDLDTSWANGYWKTSLPYATTTGDWRIYLAEHQFYHNASDTHARLKAHAKRCAQGHSSYQGHDVKKLRALVQGRVTSTDLKCNVDKATKKQLMKILEDADVADDALEVLREFHRFSELPPELKNRIFTYYFKSLGNVPPRFALPPLCQASRQLRLDSTGLFFEHCTFIVTLRPWYMQKEARLHYHTEVARLNIPTSTFACIKHLHIELRYTSIESPLLAYSVDLTDGRSTQWSRPDHGYGEYVQQQGGQHVQSLVRSITARGGQAKLQKSDFEAFEVAVSNDMWQQ